jgi:CRP/FNR family transcriptional activator FtrB
MMQANFVTLMNDARAQRFPADTELIRQGEHADFLHLVVEGRVELYSSWQGRITTMGVILPVGTIILAACIRDLPYLMSARTLEPSRLLSVPASDLRAMLRKDPEFAVSIVVELAGAFRSMTRHAKDLKLRLSQERVASYLLTQSLQAGGVERFVLQVEKRLVASYLGMTPENLSRALKRLENDGVTVKGQTVMIANLARLKAAYPPDILIDGPDPDPTSGGLSLPGPSLPMR